MTFNLNLKKNTIYGHWINKSLEIVTTYAKKCWILKKWNHVEFTFYFYRKSSNDVEWNIRYNWYIAVISLNKRFLHKQFDHWMERNRMNTWCWYEFHIAIHCDFMMTTMKIYDQEWINWHLLRIWWSVWMMHICPVVVCHVFANDDAHSVICCHSNDTQVNQIYPFCTYMSINTLCVESHLNFNGSYVDVVSC